jgi:hypothetical protein
MALSPVELTCIGRILPWRLKEAENYNLSLLRICKIETVPDNDFSASLQLLSVE